jgi:hypothetical protein
LLSQVSLVLCTGRSMMILDSHHLNNVGQERVSYE